MNSENPGLDNNQDGPLEKTNLEETNQKETTSATTNEFPSFGWSSYAERVNGRFAMIGFTAVLLIEVLSREPFLQWAGLFK